MLKNTLFIISAFFSGTLAAQTPITISSSDMPNENDSILISVNSNIGLSSATSTGANHTWDFSSLTPNTQQIEAFESPLTFTSPFNYLFNPFNTSYGRDNYEFSTIPLPGTNIDAAFDFYKESSSKYKQIGAGLTINGTPIPFLYSSDDIIYNFPMNYLSTDACDYKYGLTIPGIGYYGQTGHRVNLVDGWGTLTTPFGTFQTLRIKSTIDAVDTVYNNNLAFGTNIQRPLKYEFKWLATGMKIPVLKIEASDVAGNVTVTNVRYIDSTRAGVPQVGINELNNKNGLSSSVYPNPCIEKVTLSYSLQKSSAVTINIIDVLGKTVTVLDNEVQIVGAHHTIIKIADLQLNPGVYFIHLQTEQSREIQKIVVSY
ncbi:MAG: T9SS type A sorting domain-containing protein [Bacteroidota bacterium]